MSCCSDFCSWVREASSINGQKKAENLEEIGIPHGNEARVTTIEESLRNDSVGTSNGSSYKIKQLFNKHGYNLAILDGHVKGRQADD